MTQKRSVGQPPKPAHLKRNMMTTRLPQWLIDWLNAQNKSKSVLIEEALCKVNKLKQPKD